MTFRRGFDVLTIEVALDVVTHLADEGPVRGVLARAHAPLGSREQGEPTGGSTLLSGDTQSWVMRVQGFPWDVEPRLVATADDIRVDVLARQEPIQAQDEREARDFAAFRVLSLLDPRTVVRRSRQQTPSGTVEQGQLDCAVAVQDLGVPVQFLEWLGASAGDRPVRLLFEAGRLVEMRQQDLPPFQADLIIEAFERA